MTPSLPGPFRLGRSPRPAPDIEAAPETDQVEFLAYGEDCILVGRTALDAERLTDMLNAHDEYLLEGVTVERLDEGESFELAEIAVPRDEIYLVHANEPRGDIARRHHTMPQHLAIKLGPYRVRGFFHALPGADPVEALRRRMAMVPLTDARIEYRFQGETRAIRVDVVIVNREQIDWVQEVSASQVDFPADPEHLAPKPA
jgi:hypothetical protein